VVTVDTLEATGRGRPAEVDLLLASSRAAPSTAAVVISAVSGTAGVGKTALATHWAHRRGRVDRLTG
jgi:predicted ATPase